MKRNRHNLDDDTPLIPEIIAAEVTNETEEIAMLCERARLHYSNPACAQFRRRMNGVKCREYLAAFMQNWLEASKRRNN